MRLIWAIRDALTSVDDILGELDGVDGPRDLTELGRTVMYAWRTDGTGRYATLAAMLPRLLADAHAATHAATAAETGRAADLATQVHQVAAGTLARFGAADLGHVAAREALRLADVAHTQLRLGRTQAAESTLIMIEHAAPEWTALHRLPRVLVGELLTRGRPSSRLRELAHRLQTTPAAESL